MPHIGTLTGPSGPKTTLLTSRNANRWPKSQISKGPNTQHLKTLVPKPYKIPSAQDLKDFAWCREPLGLYSSFAPRSAAEGRRIKPSLDAELSHL